MDIDTTIDEKLGMPPVVMTADMYTPDGKRYNFEQVLLDTTTCLELVTDNGDRIILQFWSCRQSEKNFPVDPESSIRYETELMPKICKAYPPE